MAQHDYVIANGTGAAVRSDLNNALAAIVSNNSGATEPTTTYAYMWWPDTSSGNLKLRNGANNAWITIGPLATTGFGFLSSGGTLTAALGSASTPGITFTGDLNTGIYSPGADQVAISTNGSGRLFVDASGRVLVGTSTSLSTNAGFTPNLQVAGTVTDAAMSVFQYRNATGAGGSLTLSHSRGASVGTQTILQNGDSFGILLFEGSDGTNPVQGALIKGEVDGTPGTNDMPGRIVLSTTADGASSPTERMRIDSAGRVGIGTTSPTTALDVAGNARVGTKNSNSLEFYIGGSWSANDYYSIAWSNQYQTSSEIRGIQTEGSGSSRASALAFLTTSNGNVTSERARIDSSGRLLVGTSSAPSAGDGQYSRIVAQGYTGLATGHGYMSLARGQAAASISSGDEIGTLAFTDSAGYSFARIGCTADAAAGNNDYPGRLTFSTTADGASSPTERMRLQSTGKLLLGTTSTLYGNYYQFEIDAGAIDCQLNKTSGGAGAACYGAWNSATTGNNAFLIFYTESSIVSRGSIDYNRAAGQVRYNVTSDRRLKSDIQPAATALGDLSAIQVRSYKWTETGYQVNYGFIAQELNEIAPDAVKVGNDGDEVTDTWAVDNAKLVPLLTKALQEALAEISMLKDRVAALEAA